MPRAVVMVFGVECHAVLIPCRVDALTAVTRGRSRAFHIVAQDQGRVYIGPGDSYGLDLKRHVGTCIGSIVPSNGQVVKKILAIQANVRAILLIRSWGTYHDEPE